MKQRIFLCLCILFSGLLQAQDPSKAAISYRISPKLKAPKAAVEVSFEFATNAKGELRLRYENNTWGDQNIFNCLQGFSVYPEAKDIQFLRDSSLIIIHTEANSTCLVRYQITQDYAGLPSNEKRYRPMIDSNYFHLLGMRLFVIPEAIFPDDNSKARIAYHFEEEEETFLFHSSFGQQKNQSIELVREDLYASFFLGGDFRRHHFLDHGDTIFFLSRGNWRAFKDEDIFQILQETMYSQREFWQDSMTGNFAVSLVPTYETWYSIGGSGFSNSFISFASNNDQVTLKHLRWLYNHELLHKWIGRTIINKNEVVQYWFSEGFTDYYAYKLQLKCGQISLIEYLQAINQQVLIPHQRDSLNEIPNSRLSFNEYWANYSKYQKLPYRRGFLYALYLDNQLKLNSQGKVSLDNLMRDLLHQAKANPNLRFEKTLFLASLAKYHTSKSFLPEFERYILEGKLIDFSKNVPPGLKYTWQEGTARFSLDATQAEKVKHFLGR